MLTRKYPEPSSRPYLNYRGRICYYRWKNPAHIIARLVIWPNFVHSQTWVKQIYCGAGIYQHCNFLNQVGCLMGPFRLPVHLITCSSSYSCPYSAVILSSPLASGFLSSLTMPLGISDAALSQNTDKVRGQQKLDFRMTISFVSEAVNSESPLPDTTKDLLFTIISIFTLVFFFRSAWRNR